MGPTRLFAIIVITFLYIIIGIEALKNGYAAPGIGVLIISLGILLNLAAVLGNNWQMPVLIKHTKEKQWLENNPTYTILNKKARFKLLCDIYRRESNNELIIFSIGDCLITIGKTMAIFATLVHILF